MKKRNIILTLISIVLIIVFLMYANENIDSYKTRIINLCAIYIILALSMNLINGFTGLFSLGHAGFIAIGAYVTALLTMSPESKAQNFFMVPIWGPLANIQLPFMVALIIGGLAAAFIAFLIGAPVLRLRGDYLAIATLGFAEIIRVIFTNAQSITNGSLGLKGIPSTINLYWSFGIAIITVVLISSLINSSFGRSLKAIREDEIAAEGMGINLFRNKMLAFVLGAFFAGIGGGLLASITGTIDPSMFKFMLTFNILLIIVLGGMGSVTGTIISSIIITVAGEALRFLDENMDLGFVQFHGIAGLRMVVFSGFLVIAVLFFGNGVMGTKEFSWDKLIAFFKNKTLLKGGKDNGVVEN